MKKQLLVVLLALVLTLTVVVGIACEPQTEPTKYTVTYESGLGGGTAPAAESYEQGASVTLKAASTFTAPEGKEFDGWLVDGEKKAAGAAITMPAKDLTITAQWKDKSEPQPEEKWTVTFKCEGQEDVVVQVVKGQKLTAEQIPAAPAGIPEDKEFKGWYVGDDKITVDTVIGSDITANAKIELKPVEKVTVTFKVGEDVVTTVELDKGDAILAAQIPSCPADKIPEGYGFDGWYNEETKLQIGTEITADITFVAQFNALNWVVTFKNGEEVVKTVQLSKEGNGKVAANDIPKIESDEENGIAFAGWFNGKDKIGEKAITSDIIYSAKFVTISDFAGTYYSDENACKIIITAEGKVTSNKFSGEKTATLDFETGNLVCVIDHPDWTAKEQFVITVREETISVEYSYYVDIDYTQDKFTCEVMNSVSSLEGTWTSYNSKGGNRVLKIESGWVTQFGTSGGSYGRLIAVNDNSITFISEGFSGNNTYTATILDEGNIISIDNVLYVKGIINDTQDISARRCDIDDKRCDIIQYSVGQEKIYIWRVEDQSPYSYGIDSDTIVTIEGIFAEGNVITVKFSTSNERKIKIISGRLFAVAGSEAGPYTVNNQNIILDGFGNATVDGDSTKTYYTIVKNVIVIDELGFRIEENGSCTVLTIDNIRGEYVLSGETSKNMILDGFGGLMDQYLSAMYYGSYTISADKKTITVSGEGLYYVKEGVYTIEQNGEVILFSDNFTAYVKKNATINSQLNGFAGENDGYWTNGDDVVDINILTLTIQIGASSVNFESNWNGSVLLRAEKVETDYQTTFITVDAGQLKVVVRKGNKQYDGEIVSEKTYASTARPSVELDVFAGTYVQEGDAYQYELTFDGKGTFTVASKVYPDNRWHNGSIAYTAVDNVVTLKSFLDYSWTITLNSDGTITVNRKDSDGYTNNLGVYTKVGGGTEPEPTPAHSCVGTWTGTQFSSTQCTLVVNADGTLDLNGTKGQWTSVNDNEITFTIGENVYVVNSTAKTVKFEYDYTDYSWSNVTFTSASSGSEPTEPELDAFAGTWVNENSSDNYYQYELTFDGKGTFTVVSKKDTSSKWHNGTTTYVIVDNVITLDGFLDYKWVITLDGSNLVVNRSDSDGFAANLGTFTKQA